MSLEFHGRGEIFLEIFIEICPQQVTREPNKIRCLVKHVRGPQFLSGYLRCLRHEVINDRLSLRYEYGEGLSLHQLLVKAANHDILGINLLLGLSPL